MQYKNVFDTKKDVIDDELPTHFREGIKSYILFEIEDVIYEYYSCDINCRCLVILIVDVLLQFEIY